MMIPGEWEPRRPHRVAVEAPAHVRGSPFTPTRRRDGLPTWLEVSIAVTALLVVMFLAMWASG
jgi:hypothetical protein